MKGFRDKVLWPNKLTRVETFLCYKAKSNKKKYCIENITGIWLFLFLLIILKEKYNLSEYLEIKHSRFTLEEVQKQIVKLNGIDMFATMSCSTV